MEIWILTSFTCAALCLRAFQQRQQDGLKKTPAHKRARCSYHTEKTQNWAGSFQVWLLIFSKVKLRQAHKHIRPGLGVSGTRWAEGKMT